MKSICKSRECNKAIPKDKTKRSYCSKKCRSREIYLKSKENGFRSGKEKKIYKKECKYRGCKKAFETQDMRKEYCCSNCGKYEHKMRKRDDYDYISTVNPEERVCASRKCKKPFIATWYNAKYCSNECCKAENNVRRYEKKCDLNPPKRKYTNHRAMLQGNKLKEYVNPNFSAKWLQDLWDKRKERECA